MFEFSKFHDGMKKLSRILAAFEQFLALAAAMDMDDVALSRLALPQCEKIAVDCADACSELLAVFGAGSAARPADSDS